MSLAHKAAIFLICAAFPLWAAPTLTTIQDTIYNADGTNFNGIAVISWNSFDASDNSKIGLQSLTVRILNGALYVQLVPNTNATPVNYYTVQYSSDGMKQFTEMWAVPPSTTPVTVREILVTPWSAKTSGSGSGGSGGSGGGVTQSPGGGTPIPESDVTGLLNDLALRPLKGASYTTGTAAMIDDSGTINSVIGNATDCVHVDGTSGACIDSTALPVFIDYETPGGTIDGNNATFTLANTPNPTTSLSVFRNGLVLEAGLDYNLQLNGSILFVPAAVPQPGDILLASYRTISVITTSDTAHTALAGHALPVQPLKVQILCSGSGSATSKAGYVSLGSCVIPADKLAAGDRVEVRFSFLHPGTTEGFEVQVLWGRTTLVERKASAQDSVVSGHGEATPGSGATALDVQTWGTVLPLVSSATAAQDSIHADINVDFRAAMTAAGRDKVALQNYTVLRYPAQ